MNSFIAYTALLFLIVQIIGTAPPQHIFHKPRDFQPTGDRRENGRRSFANMHAWYDMHMDSRVWDMYLGLWWTKLVIALLILVTTGQFPGTLIGSLAYVVFYFFLALVLIVTERLWGTVCGLFGFHDLLATWFDP
ncbi:uncharacterized protein FFB20_07166 [Fusarium fujikuroi]|uniref:Uncharacterized protein n=2 Tax=Fusarium fujikuroi TaxID=5127 RepID=S0E979_GIBF5|nr:uncharacterized protein FFUJ_07947 [Fusarium fujikuroi IMI 58289]KLO87175.1 uncharacterized protein LW93_13034 [Fusarium fujikuroi]KLP11750.1 uncharacterized protein Y057_13620 [Fusarium fujikuroi]KLP17009.1 uncharacterized protein LW94_9097 [Fusarium fujikuroi]QGI65055.1 hypothetical protein CEK27_009026 [Fusarium fujikuroi]QGI82309.1 hypothetical protein CEK25_009038 [Fusarium fujikuroi]